LALLERMLEQVQPEILLTYGGYWLARAIVAAARGRGIPVVFFLCNLDYRCAETFDGGNAVLVPSTFAQEHYCRTLGLPGTAIPGPLDWTRVHCPRVEGRFVTFVNPQPAKGGAYFARIATELNRRRPDIPLLVVEGRAKADALGQTGLELHRLGNVHVMTNTPDPRAFYRVSRLLLVPSLCQEAFGRVAAEALLNGIPVLTSRRGGLSEVLAEAGFLFDVPECYTPAAGLVPSAEEVEPWIAMILRLWDDSAFYAQEGQRCLAAAEVWRPERLGPRLEACFTSVLRSFPGRRGCRGEA
jgi:glycosyltransferase involved in cell wall biosynthesis